MWEGRLRTLYRSKIDFKNVGTHHWWVRNQWTQLLDSTGMFVDEAFTRVEGTLCYYYAKFEVRST